MRTILLVGVGLAITACSSSSDGEGEAVTCKIGELEGTWSITYAEKDGNCGKLASETVVLQPGKTASPSACQVDANTISADKCRIDLDYTCPLATGTGSQHWVGTMHQTKDTQLTGSMTIQAVLNGSTCRSTYDVAWTRQ